MPCTYTIDGKTYTAWEFDDYLRSMPPEEAAKYMDGVEAPTQLSPGRQTETPEFKRWSKGNKLIPRDEIENGTFSSGEPVVVEVVHGTTGDFTVFSAAYADIESDLGGGFYFTNNTEDVGENYAGLGPDLTQKVERDAERIADEEDTDMDEAREIAKQRYMANLGTTMPVFVRFDNPVVLGGEGETFLDINEGYDEETGEYGEPTGPLVDFVEALREVGQDTRYGDADIEQAIAGLWERAGDYSGLKASELIDILSSSEGLQYATDYENDRGALAGKEIIRKAFEAAGFDGFIDQTVNKKFGSEKRIGKAMAGMDENTVHFIAFDPTQIKSATGNQGTFDGSNPDIRYSPTRTDFPDAIVANPLGEASSSPDHDKAKAGDPVSGMRLALKLVTPDLVSQLRSVENPVVLGVVSVEATGRNKLPDAAAALIAKALGGQKGDGVVQSTSPRRTQMDGLDRGFNRPSFSGEIEDGRNYILVDDTITQGGTLVSFAQYVEGQGGKVAALVSLTGKQYSRIIKPSEKTLAKLREIHGDLENEFHQATGYGFDGLTESEARYLANFKPAQSVRDRILALGASSRQQDLVDDAQGSRSLTPVGGVTERYSPTRNQAGVPVPQSWNEKALPEVKSKRERFIYEVQDKFVDLKRAQEAIRESGIAIRDEFNPYLVEETFHGAAAYQVQVSLEHEFEPILKDMKLRSIKLEDFDMFLRARHAKERNAEMAKRNPNQAELDRMISDLADAVFNEPDPKAAAKLETKLRHLRNTRPYSGTEDERNALSGMSNKDADAFLKSLGSRRNSYEALGNKVDEIVAENRRLLGFYGLETAETVRALEKQYQHYIPLMRDLDEADLLGSGGTGTGAGYSVRGSTLKEATGSLREVESPFTNLLAQREQIVVRGEKAKVARAVYGLSLTAPNPEFWSVIVPGKMTQSQISKALAAAHIDPTLVANMSEAPVEQYLDPETGLVRSRINPLLTRDPNAFVVRINGEDRVILFNSKNERATRLVMALKNEDAERFQGGPLRTYMQSVGAATRWISSVNTQYNPIFGMKNFVRDIQGAVINASTTEVSDRKAAVLKGVPHALRAIWRQERGVASANQTNAEWMKLWDQFQADGGMTGYRDQFNGLEDRVKALQHTLKGRWYLDKTGLGYILKLLSDYNNAIENGVRLAAYKEALDKGVSRQRAASLAKNLTVNFNRKGRTGTFASSHYAFFNAAVQGNARIIETAQGGHKGKAAYLAVSKFVGAGVSIGVAYTLIGIMFMGDDWEEIPEFIRERELIIPLGKMDIEGANIGTTKSGYRYMRIPMALGFHAVPNVGRNLVEMAYFGEPGDRVANILTTAVDAANPMGGGNSFLEYIAPSVIDPFVQLVNNENAFGRPIAKQNFSEKDPTPAPDRFFRSASSFGKAMSWAIDRISGGDGIDPGALQATPDQVDFAFGQVTGGVGRESLKLYQFLENQITGEKTPESRVPIVGMFYGKTQSDQAVTGRFFELEKKVNIAEKQLASKTSIEAQDKVLQDKPEARVIQDMKVTIRRIRRLDKARKRAAEAGDQAEVDVIDKMIRDERRWVIDLYNDERNRDR